MRERTSPVRSDGYVSGFANGKGVVSGVYGQRVFTRWRRIACLCGSDLGTDKVRG